MFTLPISDTSAISVDDADPDTWWVHTVDFQDKTIQSFSVEGLGKVQSAHFDPGRGLLWVIVQGNIFAIQLSEQQIFEIPMPDQEFFVYTLTGTSGHVYVGGEYSNLWRIALPALEWEPLLTPEPKPERAKNKDEQTRQNTEYARKYPPLYSSFDIGEDHLFCGALGALARVRGRSVEIQTIETGARLVTGRREGAQISLSADNPAAEIYLGDFDTGFETIFSDNLRAFHRTAVHRGQRYIGVAEYPISDVRNLYLQTDGGLVPVETGCARDPLALISLSTTGSALWAIDAMGMFRLFEGVWALVGVDDLRRQVWPDAD